jgi:hypothetical protein
MKKKVRDTQWDLPYPIDLFLDDLVTVVEHMSAIGPVAIETDGFTQVSVGDLGAMRESPPRTLVVTASIEDTKDSSSTETLMRLDVALNHLVIWIIDDRPELYGIYNKVREVVESRRLRRWSEPGVVPWVGILVVLTSLAVAAIAAKLASLIPILLLLAGAIAAQVLLPDGPKTGKRRLVFLHMYRSSEHRTFWDRQGEALLLNALVAFVFFIFGFVVQAIWQP